MKRRTDIGFGSEVFKKSMESLAKTFNPNKIVKATDSDMDRIPSPSSSLSPELARNSKKGFGSLDF